MAERKHRHIVETGLTLLAHASAPFRFWSDAFSTACFLINRLPTQLLGMKTPLELLLNESLDYTFLKVFGCACWPHLRPYNKRKLEFRSKLCVFLGYSSLHKGYKYLHIPSNRVYISHDVVFDENVFPFSSFPMTPAPPVSSSSSTSPLLAQFVDIAYSPALLPNHAAGTGRGARLELLDEQEEPSGAPGLVPGAMHAPCMPPARPGSAAPASPARPESAAAPALPRLDSPGPQGVAPDSPGLASNGPAMDGVE